MTVADDNARSLSAITPEEPLRLVAARPLLAAVAPVVVHEDGPEDSPAAILTSRAWGGPAPVDAADDADDDAAFDAEDGPVDRDDEPEEAPGADEDALAEVLESELADEREQEALAEAAVVGLHDPDDVVPADEVAGDAVELDAVEGLDDLEEAELDEPESESESDEPIGAPAAATADAEDVPLFDTPAPKPGARSGRPAVPSFDDILFGPGPKPQE
jgi:hypothetical protein